MDPGTVTCSRCDGPVAIDDLRTGWAVRLDGQPVCPECIDELPPATRLRVSRAQAARLARQPLRAIEHPARPGLLLYSFTTASAMAVHRRTRTQVPTQTVSGLPASSPAAPVPLPVPPAAPPLAVAVAVPSATVVPSSSAPSSAIPSARPWWPIALPVILTVIGCAAVAAWQPGSVHFGPPDQVPMGEPPVRSATAAAQPEPEPVEAVRPVVRKGLAPFLMRAAQHRDGAPGKLPFDNANLVLCSMPAGWKESFQGVIRERWGLSRLPPRIVRDLPAMDLTNLAQISIGRSALEKTRTLVVLVPNGSERALPASEWHRRTADLADLLFDHGHIPVWAIGGLDGAQADENLWAAVRARGLPVIDLGGLPPGEVQRHLADEIVRITRLFLAAQQNLN